MEGKQVQPRFILHLINDEFYLFSMPLHPRYHTHPSMNSIYLWSHGGRTNRETPIGNHTNSSLFLQKHSAQILWVIVNRPSISIERQHDRWYCIGVWQGSNTLMSTINPCNEFPITLHDYLMLLKSNSPT